MELFHRNKEIFSNIHDRHLYKSQKFIKVYTILVQEKESNNETVEIQQRYKYLICTTSGSMLYIFYNNCEILYT